MDAQSLGRYLRESRTAREITLDDAESVLRIRRRVLEAFEAGDFDATDASPVQVRGFIRNYAAFLGLDPDRVVEYYEVAIRGGGRKRRFLRRKRKTSEPLAPLKITDTPPSLPAVTFPDREYARPGGGFLNRLVIILLSLAAVVVIVFVTVQLVIIPGTMPDPYSVPPEVLQIQVAPTLTLLPTFTPANLPTEVPSPQQAYTGQGVMVTIEFSQRSWVRLSTDGIERYTGIALPEVTVLEYQANERIDVTAGNAGGLIVVYNGQAQGSFGRRGQQVDITFMPDRMDVSSAPGFEPTPEYSPTPEPTSESLAATLLAELTPSNTPGPSPTPTLTPSETPTLTYTPTATFTPSITPTPSDTPTITPTPSPTAILPPRVTQPNLTPTKDGA